MATDQQDLEIEALRAIYLDDFVNCPTPTVWKGAPSFPEFKIRVKAGDPLAERVHFLLHVKFPKTYPRVLPTLSIEDPTGLSKPQINQLNTALRVEGQKALGREMIFELVNFSQEWITENHSLPKEDGDKISLAEEMEHRAEQLQREEAQRAKEEDLKRRQQHSEVAASLARQIDEGKEKRRGRRTITEGPEFSYAPSEYDQIDQSNMHTFDTEIKCHGFSFTAVVLSNARPEGVGITYRADADCDQKKGADCPILEAHRVLFDHPHYKVSYGHKKVVDVQREINKLKTIEHPNLPIIFATDVDLAGTVPRLTILLEQRPLVTLKDVLSYSDGLRLDRAMDYFGQIISGLGALHAHNICHRGLTAECIGLMPIPGTNNKSRLKIGRCSYYARLADLHRSNTITSSPVEDWAIPREWVPPEAIDRPLEYPPSRDIWCSGIILIQMLRGFNIVEHFHDYQSALGSDAPSAVANLAAAIFVPNRKKSPSCLELTRKLSGLSGPLISSASIPIHNDLQTPVAQRINNSPENPFFPTTKNISAFSLPQRINRGPSRYKDDWEELEFLGKGGFGSVVKARNKLDGRIYAIKKVKLRGTEHDDKIFREVNALSRLNHRYIVRYFATWLETAQSSRHSRHDSDDDSGSDDDSAASDMTASRKRNGFTTNEDDMFRFDLDDLTKASNSKSKSFPSIHFGDDSSRSLDDEEEEEHDTEEDGSSNSSPAETESSITDIPVQRVVPRVLYIQMEFVEQQTLRELVQEELLTEDHAWTLFRQILEAVGHISSLGILHRDLKLSNIFLDSKGEPKIGDFGLATSSLAAVDPSDVEAGRGSQSDGEMTSGVGTSLYVAPEVLQVRGRNHSKADMYSLGIVFFEMNYKFNTASERVAVLQQLRQPHIPFPADFNRELQKRVITWLLQHDPSKRPTAAELLRSSFLPQQMEDAYFKEASRLMANPNSPHYAKLLNALFTQPIDRIRNFLYDEDERPEHAALDSIVEDRIAACFKLHGAISMEPLLMMPATEADIEDPKTVLFLDRQGELVALPKHAIVPFARIAGRMGTERIKRYTIGATYRPSPGGHPKSLRVAVFDLITTDPTESVSEAEAISVVSEILTIFPGVNNVQYEIHISHIKICKAALARLSSEQRRNATAILDSTKISAPQKRVALSKLGLARTTVDELELLLQIDEVEPFLNRLSKTSFGASLQGTIREIQTTVSFAASLGVKHKILLRPWLGNQDLFCDGIFFEVTKGAKRSDVIASGGRYDTLLAKYRPPTAEPSSAPIRAVGVQLAVDKITIGLALHQRNSIKTLLKEKRSYGLWSPRRCDVYIASNHQGGLAERLGVAALLWQNDISADMMYESAVVAEEEDNIAMCQREGILFLISQRSGTTGRQMWRVRSVLRGTEQDMFRHELVPHLQLLIQEQRRVDKSQEPIAAPIKPKEAFDVPLVLAPDSTNRKQKQTTKNIYQLKANAIVGDIRESVQASNPAVIGVDVSPQAWAALTASSAWIMQDAAWKTLLDDPHVVKEVASHLREMILQRRNAENTLIYVFSLRDEKLHLYHLP